MESDGAGGSGSVGGAGDGGGGGGGAAAAAAAAAVNRAAGEIVGSLEPEKKTTTEGEPKVKRKMKTASQLQLLEKTYAKETYPSEELRAELSVKLGLSDRQLQMWFCHRRLKDRKAPTDKEKRQRKSASPPAVAVAGRNADEITVNNAEVENEHGPGLSLFNSNLIPHPPQKQRAVHKAGTAVPRMTAEMPVMRRFYEPPLAISEQRAIAFVEAQLGEPLSEDGPILGMEFDPLPPGAFGAPIVTPVQQKPSGRSHEAQLYEKPDPKLIKGASRAVHEFQFLPENPSLRSDSHERPVPSRYYSSPSDVQSARFPSSSGKSFKHGNEQVSSGHNVQGQTQMLNLLPHQGQQGLQLSPAPGEVDFAPRVTPLVTVNNDANYVVHPATVPDNQIITPDRRVNEERLEKKCKSEEARIAREVEAHEKRIRKELEKQDILRRKREEQMRKEIERQEREQRKEEERLLREKQREDERYQREQRREMERREKFLQKEYIRAEKKRLKEEMRREKEAARLRAAHDRAAARKIAKESTELIEDEQLELMEFAALDRGLSSVMALDSETLQNLDLLKDKLPDFPPKSVLLKRPFGVQPWADSEQNIGKLLMVWRFLITFTDVLGLWPFTLDEFAQAFHDYDPRLLGEIHIAILRCIIKDIEDVARTPANALGANQNSAVNPGGGHPHIVEGAYAWGFDICSWQRHLTPLTWPEVLRQFALAARFGPKLKKRSIEPGYHHDEIEDDDGADAISNLRNGVAAEKAVAIMQERGLSNSRRSRHCLTPGTVKFAAFHILSLEGSRGLTILEVADKIQKSGLRDLTTSKTPEASISAALSRDTKLFERTAPSTYCVRSPYRKDPADTEAILSAAREKIHLFRNKYVNGEGTDEVEKEDAERDQESESDIVDDPEVDNLDAELQLNKENIHSNDTGRFEVENRCGYEKDNTCSELMVDTLKDSKRNSTSAQSPGFSEIRSCGTYSGQNADVIRIHLQNANPDQEDTVIDECASGEPWVQGLTLGEYASLSVDERLDALVALIGVANEGNAIRSTLEERLEAANAVKKQMWVEAQLDRRRAKEDYIVKMQHSSCTSNRAEQNISLGAFEDRRSPLPAVDGKNETASAGPLFQMELNGQQSDQNYVKDLVGEKTFPTQEYLVGFDNPSHQQSLNAAEKSRSELKAYISHRAEEMYVYRSLPLGQDRRRNRYWQFMASPSQNDPASGIIFVELQDGRWRLIDTEQGFDALLASLDVRGVRESNLRLMLQRIETSFKAAARKNLCTNSGQHVGEVHKNEVWEMGIHPNFRSSTESPKKMTSIPDFSSREPFSSAIQLVGRNGTQENGALQRYRGSEKWTWEESFNCNIVCALKYGTLQSQPLLEICDCSNSKCLCEDNLCPCHGISDTSNNIFGFSVHGILCKRKIHEASDGVLHKIDLSVPPRIRLLKAQLAMMEASIPQEALEPIWSNSYRKSWGLKLRAALTAEDLLQALTLLEGGLKRDFLLANFETTNELLGSSNVLGCLDDNSSKLDAVIVLPWLPLTTSAVALRLMELDTSICYTPDQRKNFQKETMSGNFNKFPSRYSGLSSGFDNIPPQVGKLQQEDLNGRTSMKRGRGRPRGSTYSRGGKSQRKVINPRNGSDQVTTTRSYEIGQLTGWKGRPRGRGGCKKGRRSVRSRQKSVNRAAVEISHEKVNDVDLHEIPSPVQQEWNLEETPIEGAGGDEGGSSSERSAYDDFNGQQLVDEYDEVGHFEEDDEIAEGDGDGDDYMDDDDIEGYFNGDYNEPGNTSTGGVQVSNQNRTPDRGSVSPSSSSSADYSY